MTRVESMIDDAFRTLVADPPRPELQLTVYPDEDKADTWVISIRDHRHKTYQIKRFSLGQDILNDHVALPAWIRLKVRDMLERLDAFEHGLTWDEFKHTRTP